MLNKLGKVLAVGLMVMFFNRVITEGTYNQQVNRKLHQESYEQLDKEYGLLDREEVSFVYGKDSLVWLKDSVSGKRYNYIEGNKVSEDTLNKEIETFKENRVLLYQKGWVKESWGMIKVVLVSLMMFRIILGILDYAYQVPF